MYRGPILNWIHFGFASIFLWNTDGQLLSAKVAALHIRTLKIYTFKIPIDKYYYETWQSSSFQAVTYDLVIPYPHSIHLKYTIIGFILPRLFRIQAGGLVG